VNAAQGASVLVVGAGALGLTCAYHLQCAGAAISFLVRPHRAAGLSRPQRLYSYHEQCVHTLDPFAVYTGCDALRGREFDFVLLTLDGATCRSEQGVATLADLGRALAGTRAILLLNGVGVGLYEHVRATTGLPASRLLEGTMRSLAYQVGGAGTPLPAADLRALHDGADVAYFSFADAVAFFVAGRPRRAARRFIGLFNRCGFATCGRMPRGVFRMSSSMFFPFSVASELDGWRGTQALVDNAELWALCCAAQREIAGLRRFGIIGWLAARKMNDASLAARMLGLERDAGAIGFTAFNRYHHGGKVLGQALQVLENCVAIGVAEGKSMAATRALLARRREQLP